VKADSTSGRHRPNGALAQLAGSLLLIAALAACGGGGGGTSLVTENPAPTLNSISPTSAAVGGAAFPLSVYGSNFISSSIVRWNGSGRATTYVSSGQLTATILASDIASAGTAQVTVFNPAPGGGASAALTFTSYAPLAITTTWLADTTGGKPYDYTLGSTGGLPPITWAVISGAMPNGLSLDGSSGRISGQVGPVTSPTTKDFTVKATDSASSAGTAAQPLSIVVHVGNDVCTPGSTEGKTQLLPGSTLRASLSPYGDIDVYWFQGTAGAHVTIEIFAQRLNLDNDSSTQDSYLDSILELLDSNCNVIALNDDISLGSITDSKISVSSTPFPSPPCPPSGPPTGVVCADVTPPTALPYTGTYFIRVRDFRGDGRPDFIYDLSLSGAN
jgi:hypothetical protein